MVTDVQKTSQALLLIPFELVGSLLAAVVLPAITFTTEPDTISECCVQPLTSCGTPTCSCYVSSSSGGNATLVNEYALQCPNVVASNESFIQACAEVEISLVQEQFLRTGIILFFVIMTTVIGVLPASKSTASNKANPFKMFESIKYAFSHYSFRLLALRQGLVALNSQILIGFGNFFLLYNVGIDFVDLGSSVATVAGMVLGGALISAPLWYLIIRLRAEDGVTPRYHPADIAWVSTFVGASLSSLLYILSSVNNDPNLLYAGAAIVGLSSGSLFQVISILFGWIIDEDELEHNLRREGMFYACSDAVRYIATVLFYVLIAIMGALGQDPSLCPASQPEGVKSFVFFQFAIFSGILQFINCICLYYFPIRGERLETILKNNSKKATKAAESLSAESVHQSDSQ